MSRFTDTVSDLKNASAYALADRAECMSPDSHESAGADFLTRVRDDVLEAVEDLDTFDDAADFERMTDDASQEVADNAVPIYTAAKWSTFADLGAYQEDVSEFAGDDVSDMDHLGSLSLYVIADRLVRAILAELADAIREDDADRGDDESDVLL